MDERHFRDEVIRVALLAGEDAELRDLVFERCDIKGPAVILPRACRFEFNRFYGSQDAIFWELPDDRRAVIGAVLVENCSFTGCTFMGIGVAGPASLIDQLRKRSPER